MRGKPSSASQSVDPRLRFRRAHWTVPAVFVGLALILAACADGSLTGEAGGKQAAPVVDKSKPAPKAKKPAADPAAPQKVASAPALRDLPKIGDGPMAPPAPKLLKPPVADSPPPVRIALLLPLSGDNATLGRALLDAAQLALFDVAGPRFTLMPRDTGGDAEGAAKATEAVIVEGAEIILGPVFSSAVQAAGEVAREREINVVAFSTDRSIAGNGIYLMSFMSAQQVDRVVAYATSQGLRRFASLAPATPYGDEVVNTLAQAAVRGGGEVVQVERYAPEDTEVMEPARRLAAYDARAAALKERRAELALSEEPADADELARLKKMETLGEVDFEAVLLPEGGARLRRIAPLLPFFDVDPGRVRFLGTGLWDDEQVGREPALVGGWFAGPDPELGKSFRSRFEAVFGYRPPRIASLSYDATALAAVLASGASADFSAIALSDPSGFAGADGLFRFRPDGIAERGLAVLEVRPRGLRVIDPAPASFDKSGS